MKVMARNHGIWLMVYTWLCRDLVSNGWYLCHHGYTLLSCQTGYLNVLQLECAWSCDSSESCRSYFYNTTTRQCCHSPHRIAFQGHVSTEGGNMMCVTSQNVSLQDCGGAMAAADEAASGFYSISPSGAANLQVYCDMESEGGGWMVLQRRTDGSEDFDRSWSDYQAGFGRLDKEFWLGNDALAIITNQRQYELRVDLEDFEGNKVFASYSHFSVDGSDNYKISLGQYSGTAGDSLSHHNGQSFSTFDRDNDIYDTNCALQYKGGWWYRACHESNLNGQYQQGSHETYADGVNWFSFKGYHYSLKFTEMKIRPTA